MIAVEVLCSTLSLFAVTADAARILGIVPTPSYSHQVLFQPIWRELSLRGHQVTTITTDPINDPQLVNLTEIDLHCLYDLQTEDLQKMFKTNSVQLAFLLLDTFETMLRVFLSHPKVQSVLKNETERFDLVMVEYGILHLFAIAKRFEAPLIAIYSIDAPVNLLRMMGNPTHAVIYPQWYSKVQDNSSLWNRLVLVAGSVVMRLFKLAYVDPVQQSLIDKYFGLHYPKVRDLEKNISLILVNSDPIFHTVKPLLPTIIQIGGGYHRAAPKPLPKDLQAILDAAENGFVYFSLGSNVQSKDLSEGTQNAILEAFSELPYIVLWKFEADLPNKPENIVTAKWLPQQDVLKHPNIKLFITQGGLQSIDEAIYDHVPMIGMPFFADQGLNVHKMVAKGFGLFIDYKTLRKEEFKAAILEVINNPSYRNKIAELAQLALDQPMTGLQKAVWWTEYVVRHNGTKHLRSPELDVSFYQYYLLDVVTVFILAVVGLIGVYIIVLKLLLKLILNWKTKVD